MNELSEFIMDELSKFINENAELINNNDFNAVYLGSFFYSQRHGKALKIRES